jgi:hypothetical protein
MACPLTAHNYGQSIRVLKLFHREGVVDILTRMFHNKTLLYVNFKI